MSAARHPQTSRFPHVQGLTQAEIVILNQESEIIRAQEARQGQSQGRNERSTMAESRGRGTGRTSQASSTRGNSAASSSTARRFQLDSTSLSHIQDALDNVIRRMTNRIDEIVYETSAGVNDRAMRAANTNASADAQIAKTKKLIREMDALDAQLDHYEELFNHIKRLRQRTESLDSRFDRLSIQQVSVRPDPRQR